MRLYPPVPLIARIVNEDVDVGKELVYSHELLSFVYFGLAIPGDKLFCINLVSEKRCLMA